jgi:trans-aconitate methyltransferase
MDARPWPTAGLSVEVPPMESNDATGSAKRWDAAAYDRSFGFVTTHGEGVLADLAVQPGERVLDLGCGTGELTARIAALGAEVVGLDRDADMIRRARERYPALCFEQADGHDFERPGGRDGFDAVFSNAALHWMLRPAAVIARVRAALRPGGRFVAEAGGAGNVARVAQALHRARAEVGLPPKAGPWFFPSIATYAALLEVGGLEPRQMMLFDRPTPLAEGESAMVDWMKMFASPLVDDLAAGAGETLLLRAAELVRPALFQDGRWSVDYRRLRFVAVRTD